MRALRSNPSSVFRRARGMTFIEMGVAMVIVVLLFSAVAVGIGAITGSSAKSATNELAGVIRTLHDTAALTGNTCRLVFELPLPKSEEPVKYRAECAEGNITTSAKRDDMLRDDSKLAEDRARGIGPGSGSSSTSMEEVLAQEENRVKERTRFAEFNSPYLETKAFPDSVSVSVWSAKQRDPVDSGVAYLYFFPQGFTERAMLHVRQGDNVWTLTVSPLTGKTAVVAEALEIPRT